MTIRNVLRARSLGHRFGRHIALRSLDLEIRPGRITALLGANGAGKSTLLRLAVGLHRPRAGSIEVLGHDPCREPDAVRRRVGFVPDQPDAPRALTVAQACRFTAAHHAHWNDELVAELLDRLEIPTARRFRTLSKGQAMKAMLVLALGHDPELLLLDEPFGGLDPLVREDVLRCVLGAWHGDDRTIVCATHELDLAARFADDVVVLERGELRRHQSLDELRGGDGDSGDLPGSLRDALANASREADVATMPRLEQEEASC